MCVHRLERRHQFLRFQRLLCGFRALMGVPAEVREVVLDVRPYDA